LLFDELHAPAAAVARMETETTARRHTSENLSRSLSMMNLLEFVADRRPGAAAPHRESLERASLRRAAKDRGLRQQLGDSLRLEVAASVVRLGRWDAVA
jgi:hypothetical protein